MTQGFRKPTEEEQAKLSAYIHLQQKRNARLSRGVMVTLSIAAASAVLMAVYADKGGILFAGIAVAVCSLLCWWIRSNAPKKQVQKGILSGDYRVFEGTIAQCVCPKQTAPKRGTARASIALQAFPKEFALGSVMEQYGPDNMPGPKCKGPVFRVCGFKLDHAGAQYMHIEPGDPVLIVRPTHSGTMTAYTEYMLTPGGHYGRMPKSNVA